jgi:hypothetical protein
LCDILDRAHRCLPGRNDGRLLTSRASVWSVKRQALAAR